MDSKYIKQLIVFVSTIVTAMSVNAQSSAEGQYLPIIAQNTGNTTSAVNAAANAEIPLLQQISSYTNGALQTLNKELANFNATYVQALAPLIFQFMGAWMGTNSGADNTSLTSNIQQYFTQWGNAINQDQMSQENQIMQINQDFLGAYGTKLNYANDLSYGTMLGTQYRPIKKDLRPNVNPVYNYIKNASGVNIVHQIPYSNYNPYQSFPKNTGWTGPVQDQVRYQNYFNTVAAVTSFDAYTLSNLINADGHQYNQIQQNLITTATDSNWFTNLATGKNQGNNNQETLAAILRQLLLFQSQIFILLSELVSTQKQMLTAQVMNNSLLIAINQTNEYMAYAYARGFQPQP